LTVVLLLTLSSPALGEPPPPTDKKPVRATLVSSVSTAAPNEEFQVGVLLEMAPHWHLYWTSPGNTGTPTRVDFQWNRDHLSVDEPRFPVPEVFDAKNLEYLSFGYSSAVLVPASAMLVEAPADAKTRIRATASWLACKKTCIKGKIDLDLVLPVGDKPAPSPWAAKFKQTWEGLPEPADSERAWLESMVYKQGKHHLRIRLAGLKSVTRFIPSLPTGGICAIQEYGVQKDPAGHFVARLSFQGDSCLPGVGGLVFGKLSDGPADGPAQAFIVKAGTPESEDSPTPDEGKAAASTKEAPDKTSGTSGGTSTGSTEGEKERESLWLMLLFAFLGGLLLNVMPCVIPVVVPKMLSVVRTAQKTSDEERRRVLWANGLAYTGGVVTTMLALAVVVIAFKMVGREVGWGFQFQNPWFLVFMISLMLVLGLGMLHVYPLQSDKHQDQLKTLKKKRRKKPRWESFLTGLLVTFLGTPCTAPMLGPALGYAFTAHPLEILLMMFTVGLGLSFPFLLLGAWTGWTRLLPTRVSDRYDKIMRGMAFMLFGTGVWLLGVMASAYGAEAAMNVVWFLLMLGLVSWIFGLVTKETDPWPRRLVRLIPLVLATAVFGWWMLEFPDAEARKQTTKKAHLIKWVPFSEQKVSDLQASGKTVFIDFTADWCMNCKANERMVIETAGSKALMDELGVVPVKADNTRHDAVIHKWLKRHGRAGVPMYIILPPCGDIKETRLLPEILTSKILHEALKEAGSSKESCSP